MAAHALQTPLPVLPALSHPTHSRHVAVIGAGPCGLVAARELRREGHKVVVFEQQDQVGGTWVYNPKTESDPLSLDPAREIIHSSLYASLRTNLPRECMGYRDFPFVPVESEQRDPRRFPGHNEVLHYLRDFARKFGLCEMIRFETEVISVGLLEEQKWKVRFRRRSGGDDNEENEDFDAVVICSGHYTEPRVAEIPGIDAWPGKQMHSHNYRIPEPFQGQVVILIGSSASAVDISSEIAEVAKEVYIAIRSDGMTGLQPCHKNTQICPMIERVQKDGSVVFQDGKVVLADVILHCTGYIYHFPFLDSKGLVSVDDNRVTPLYKHVFPPALAPWLSFPGLLWKIIPFPLFESQSKWIAAVLSGRVALPSEEAMVRDVQSYYSKLEALGVPKRYTHKTEDDQQFQYNEWLSAECGSEASEEWRKQMYIAVSKNRRARPDTYRDEWEDDHLILEAYKDFSRYLDGAADVALLS